MTMRRVRGATAVVAGLVLGMAIAGPVAAGDDIGLGQGADDAADVTNSDQVDTSGPGVVGNDPVYTVPEPYLEYAYAPFCSANSMPDDDSPAGQPASFAENGVLCGGASACPDDGDIRYRVYSREMTADGEVDGDWESQGTQCRGADDPPEGGQPVITTEMIVDAARAVAPEPEVNVQPATRSYVNVPTNVYADDAAVTETVEVLGVSLPVRFAPASFRWSFGDGGSATGVGVPDAEVGAAGAVEHQYRRSGDYSITLERTYDVSVALPNGETLELPTPLSNSSEPYGLDVGEIQSVVTDVD